MYAKVIASFLLICLAAVSGGPNAFERAPAATVGGGTTPNLTETERHGDPNTHETVAALDPAEPSFKSPNQTEPFGLNAVLVEGGELLTKWNGVEADVRAENEILARCRESAEPCPRAAQKFLAIIADGRAHNGRSRIGVVNRAINLAIRPMSDLAQWGVPDRWSAPLATLTTGQGDCEDYAIAKYVALRAAGVAEDDLRLVIVHNLAVNEDHAVIAARLDGTWIVLDNRWLALVEDTQIRRVIPLFVLDHDGVKQFSPPVIADAPSRDYHQLRG